MRNGGHEAQRALGVVHPCEKGIFEPSAKKKKCVKIGRKFSSDIG
jgi:hypothetical protein